MVAHNAAFPIAARPTSAAGNFSRSPRAQNCAKQGTSFDILDARMQLQDSILVGVEIGAGEGRAIFSGGYCWVVCWKSWTTFLVLWFSSSQFVCLLCRFVCWGL